VPVKAIIPAGSGSTSVPFPDMSAFDAVTTSPEVTCTGAFEGGSLTFAAKDATSKSAVFRLAASPTQVVCTAKDTAGNTSPEMQFTVLVACHKGCGTNSAGVCIGKACLLVRVEV
jgi:hypothetical protein